jgi:hypothetical protein
MRRNYFIIGHILLVAVAIAVFSAATLFLWNWLMPAIFGFSTICFWQALGLLALCRILFGGMGGGRHRFGKMGHRRNPIHEKWMKMTPEEQKEFLKNRRFGRDFRHDFFQNDPSEKQE